MTAHECIASCIASVDTCTASIQAAGDRVRWFSFHSLLGVEPIILPRRRRKKAAAMPVVATKTQTMRANFNKADVSLLQWILKAPSPVVAIADYRARHQRVLKPKRTHTDPDIPHPDWRSRPERHLTARQLIEQQLSGKALLKELKRLRGSGSV